MSSVLRSVRKRKKGRTLGAVDVIDREEYAGLEVDARVELIRSLVPLGLMHIEELLDEEVTALAGERYARKDPSVGGRRHGSNPGTEGLAGQRVPIRVPRIRQVTQSEIPTCGRTRRCMRSRSQRPVAEACCMGSRAATTRRRPRRFPGRSACRGRRCPARSFRPAQRSSASSRSGTSPGRTSWPSCWTARRSAEASAWKSRWAVTMPGDKRFQGFVETDTEPEKVLTPFVRSLIERGLDVSQGLLVIVVGSKGLPARRPCGEPSSWRALVPSVSVARARERGQLLGQA